MVSLINNASAVTSYIVLNSRHNYIFLCFKVVYIQSLPEMGMGGNGNRGDGKNGNGNAVLEWE